MQPQRRSSRLAERWNLSHVGRVGHSRNLGRALSLIRLGGNPRHSADYERAEKFRLNVIKQQLSFVFYRPTDGRGRRHRGGRLLVPQREDRLSNLHD